MMYYVVDCCNR